MSLLARQNIMTVDVQLVFSRRLGIGSVGQSVQRRLGFVRYQKYKKILNKVYRIGMFKLIVTKVKEEIFRKAKRISLRRKMPEHLRTKESIIVREIYDIFNYQFEP